MKVSELIASLQTVNPDAKVILYLADHEDMETHCAGVATRAQLATPDPKDPEYDHFPYCKGYSFEEFNSDNENLDYVVIGVKAP